MFRWKSKRKNRCPNLSPSQHPAYRRKRCEFEIGHDSLCRISIGPYKHYWNQSSYERLHKALTVHDS